jgi:lipopolysaccharide/colanic/teichoic acid biosynthesis glycosyltransferase
MPELKQRAWLITVLVITDALAITAALLLAYYLRLGSGILPYTSPFSAKVYIRITLWAVPIWLLIFAMNRLYQFDRLLGGPEEYASIVRGCTFGVIALIILSYFERGTPLSRGWLLISGGTTILIVGTVRFLIRRIVYYLRRRKWFISKAVIIGANEQAKAIAHQLHPPVSSGIEVVGFVDDFLPIGTRVIHDLSVLASPGSLPALIKEKDISEVIVVPQAMAWESFQEVLLANGRMLNGAQVRISPGFYELLTTGVRVDHKAFVPLLTPEKARITGVDALLKTALDLGLTIIGVVIWAPALALLAGLKKVTTTGPIFQRQPVLGRGGKTFTTLTLATDSEERKNNSRWEKRLDRFLRHRGLYRLPQFIHILSGQMSLVGPRPLPADVGETSPQWLPNLLTVKPGITGPWIMVGSSWEMPAEEKRLDTYYVRNWTIWLDLQILLRTVMLVLTGTREPDPLR